MPDPPLPPATATAIAAYDKMSKGGLRFAFTGIAPAFEVDTSKGLGKALDTGWTQAFIPKITVLL